MESEIDPVALLPDEHVLWTAPGWRGGRAFLWERPVAALVLLILGLRLVEAVGDRLQRGAALWDARDGWQALLLLAFACVFMVHVLDVRGRTTFVTSRRVGRVTRFPLSAPQVHELIDPPAPARQPLRGGRVQYTFTRAGAAGPLVLEIAPDDVPGFEAALASPQG